MFKGIHAFGVHKMDGGIRSRFDTHMMKEGINDFTGVGTGEKFVKHETAVISVTKCGLSNDITALNMTQTIISIMTNVTIPTGFGRSKPHIPSREDTPI
jgi:hypothetical protein